MSTSNNNQNNSDKKNENNHSQPDISNEHESKENSRLAQSRRKLQRLESELEERFQQLYDHQKLTNGQPMNDKRNGGSWFRQHEKIENTIRSLTNEINEQKTRVDRLEGQEIRKSQGLNKQGGLNMTVENIPRIREELERAKNGESTFSTATISKYAKELERLEGLEEQTKKAEKNINPQTEALINSDKLTQWKKNPSIYFVKGLKKVALELKEDGLLVPSERYAPKTDQEISTVEKLLDTQNNPVSEYLIVRSNETEDVKGKIKDYTGQIVTNELIEELKELDEFYQKNHSQDGENYWKFYFERFKGHEFIEEVRLDIGDGNNANFFNYLILEENAVSIEEAALIKRTQHKTNEPSISEEALGQVVDSEPVLENEEIDSTEKNKVESNDTRIPINNVLESGVLTQWKKNPNIYFVKGLNRVAVELQNDGSLIPSERFAAKNESELSKVEEILTKFKEENQKNQLIASHLRVEFNESDPSQGIPNFEGQIITPELIAELEMVDLAATTQDGYYKLYLEKVTDGKVDESFRMDLGDGPIVNKETFEFLRENALSQEQVDQILNPIDELKQPEVIETNNEPITTEEAVTSTKNSGKSKAKKTREEIQKDTNDMIESALENVRGHLNNPEDVIELANFMGTFYNYSFRNAALIQAQFPHAQAVGSGKSFIDKGFQIRKGEKAIRILAPSSFKYFIDENGKSQSIYKATETQKAKIEKNELKTGETRSYRNVPVFDVSQTTATAEDLPKIFPNRPYNFDLSTVENVDLLRASLDSYATKNGLPIIDDLNSVTQVLGSAKGAYVRTIAGEEQIMMNPRFSNAEQVPTLIHELAHAKLHNPKNKNDYSKDVKEFQAELTAYTVSKHFGIDTKEESIPYIAAWTNNGAAVEDKMKEIQEVKEFSNALIKDIHAEMESLRGQDIVQEKQAEIESNVAPEDKQEIPSSEDKKPVYKTFKEKIAAAKTFSIVDIAMKHGIELKQDSRKQFRFADNPSVVITTDKNLFIENNGGYGGSSIDFVQKMIGVQDFKEAVNYIIDNDYNVAEISNEPKKPYEYNPSSRKEFKEAKEYLVSQRGIDPEIATMLHNKGFLQQDQRNNLVMLWIDDKKVVGCSEKGTFVGSNWNKIHADSDDLAGFNIRSGEPKNLKFFEAGIDMMSYMSLNKDNLQDTWFVSMEGLKPETVYNYLGHVNTVAPGKLESVSLCVDNDEAGHKFAKRFNQIVMKRADSDQVISIDPEMPSLPEGQNKWDWNNELLAQKNEINLSIEKKSCEQESLAV